MTVGLTPGLGLGMAVVMAGVLAAACVWYFRLDVRATKILFTEEAYAD